MSRPWYCQRIHGTVQRHENIDGTTVYAVQETPCDCVPPPLPPQPPLQLPPAHVTYSPHETESRPFVPPSIAVIPPLAEPSLLHTGVAPLPPLSAPPPAATNVFAVSPYGCTVADHDIYKLCGFAFCPKCGAHTVPGATSMDPDRCPLSHKRPRADPVALQTLPRNVETEEEGRRFCYLCGSSLGEPDSPEEAALAAAPEAKADAATVPPSASSIVVDVPATHTTTTTTNTMTTPATNASAAPKVVPPLPPGHFPHGAPSECFGITVLGAGTAEGTAPPPPPPPPTMPSDAPLGLGAATSPMANASLPNQLPPPPVQPSHSSPFPPAPSAAPLGELSAEDKAVIDAVLDRLVRRVAEDGSAALSPCGLPHCYLCSPPSTVTAPSPQAVPHKRCGSCHTANGAWTGNAAVTIIHNHYH